MTARIGRKFSLHRLQLCANEHGLIRLNVKRRASRPPVELPPGASLAQVMSAHLDRLIDYLFGV